MLDHRGVLELAGKPDADSRHVLERQRRRADIVADRGDAGRDVAEEMLENAGRIGGFGGRALLRGRQDPELLDQAGARDPGPRASSPTRRSRPASRRSRRTAAVGDTTLWAVLPATPSVVMRTASPTIIQARINVGRALRGCHPF
ncbi:MAG: hypothetical protein WDO24_30995 [Pseudomonadota bacterium]